MADDDLDLVIHLGDYIYEGAGRRRSACASTSATRLDTLDDYRIRHAQYRTDPHAPGDARALPVDRHLGRPRSRQQLRERDLGAGGRRSRPIFSCGGRNAYQAYYEMMPLRGTSLPHGPGHAAVSHAVVRPAGRVPGARHAAVSHRPAQRRPAASRSTTRPLTRRTRCSAPASAGGSKTRLLASPATWNVLAQQVMMGMVDQRPGRETPLLDGPVARLRARARCDLVRFLHERESPTRSCSPATSTPTGSTICGSTTVGPDAPVVATEFVGTSITSGGNATAAEETSTR